MTDQVQASLSRLFEEHRLVFWYDAAQDMRADYEGLHLDGVTKIEITNNEFGLKHRVLKQESETKFLIYKEGPAPAMKDNWLLDLELASTVFKADQAAIWLSELRLDPRMEAVVRDHTEFYRAQSRLETLKKRLNQGDAQAQIRLHMLSVCAGTEGGLDTVIEAILGELAKGKADTIKLLSRCNLMDFFWRQVGLYYGYKSENPDFEDFAITLFKSAYQRSLEDHAELNAEALLLFRRWKNDRLGADAFEALSNKYVDPLAIAADIEKRDISLLAAIDHYEIIDRHIIRHLVHALSSQTIAAADALSIIRGRQNTHWYDSYKHIYLAITYAIEFNQSLGEARLGMTSLEEGVQRYTQTWFRLDQMYRKFIFHMQKSGQTGLLGELYESLENRYTNNYLLTINDAWQDQVNGMSEWSIPGIERQDRFYQKNVVSIRSRNNAPKVAVIISDALRYEVADECLGKIRALDRFDAELNPIIGMLPSYTQLGMASLLPNKSLSLKPDSGVESDGNSTQGTASREKVLETGRSGDRVKALQAKDALNMKNEDGKALFRDNDVVYIYHNRIDAVGDKRDTEEYLPEAAEDAIEDIVTLVRKLTSANFTNVIVTADHGFLYQHRALDESDFSTADPQGEVSFKHRRFVIGKNLSDIAGMKKFTSGHLGLSGDLDVLIPNSINRMRVKGAGSRFVHGGASLQEVVVPVLRISKKREGDTSKVPVKIIVAGKSIITSGQIAITFYQGEAVTDKVQARELVAGIYASDGKLISDEHTLTFDYRSDNPREREMPRKFLLSREADNFNNQDVYLKLRERISSTSHYQDYASHSFQLRRGISTDFDF
ncbi:MAG: BREX-1 system phosphatase PglZ type A [Rhodothermales bacterium]